MPSSVVFIHISRDCHCGCKVATIQQATPLQWFQAGFELTGIGSLTPQFPVQSIVTPNPLVPAVLLTPQFIFHNSNPGFRGQRPTPVKWGPSLAAYTFINYYNISNLQHIPISVSFMVHFKSSSFSHIINLTSFHHMFC